MKSLSTLTILQERDADVGPEGSTSVPQTVILPVLLANPNFELRTGCQVQRINLDSTGKKAAGVNGLRFCFAGVRVDIPAR